jgi:hypothetical protein
MAKTNANDRTRMGANSYHLSRRKSLAAASRS